LLPRCPRCAHPQASGTSSTCAECGCDRNTEDELPYLDRIRDITLAPVYDLATTASIVCALLAVATALVWQFIATYVLALAALCLASVAASLGAWGVRRHPILVLLELAAPVAAAMFLLGCLRGSTGFTAVGGFAYVWHISRWCRLVAHDCRRAGWPMLARLHRTSGIAAAASGSVASASIAVNELGFPNFLSAAVANGFGSVAAAGVAGTFAAGLCLAAASTLRCHWLFLAR